MEKKLVGKIIHFYPKISVAVVELKDSLKAGDRISVERAGNSFEQIVKDMQIEHKNIAEAKRGQVVGLRVVSQTHEGAQVFRITG